MSSLVSLVSVASSVSTSVVSLASLVSSSEVSDVVSSVVLPAGWASAEGPADERRGGERRTRDEEQGDGRCAGRADELGLGLHP